jgi:hypothetical protein
MRPVAIALLLALGGCSAVLSKPPPPGPLQSLSECRPESAPAVGDVMLAGVSGAVGAFALGIARLQEMAASAETDPSWDPHTKADAHEGRYLAVGIAATAVALAATVSAGYGFGSARRCKNASRELMQRRWQPPPPRLDLRRDALAP